MPAAQRIGALRHRVRWERRGLAPDIQPPAETVAREDLAFGDTELVWDDTELTWEEFVGAQTAAYAPSLDTRWGDGAGNVLGDWFPRGAFWAEIRDLRGGEDVLAGRLQGRSTVLVILRANAATRTIAPDDRLIDLATNRTLNVRHATPPDHRAFITLLCESGVADG